MAVIEELGRYVRQSGQRVAELAHFPNEEDKPDVQSFERRVETVKTKAYSLHDPPQRQMDDYWDLYKSESIIREPIRAFASEVIAPGYFVKADTEDAVRDLEEWLSRCAIIEGESGKDFRTLVKKTTIQREVRGTALVEKVRVAGDRDRLYGFKPINPATMKVYTMPGQSILLPPLTREEVAADPELEEERLKFTDDGVLAAYVQFDTSAGFTSRSERRFSRDDIIKLTRDADVGEIFGESRIAAVEERLDSLKRKLQDNDLAIESTAFPYWLFVLGTDENPWDPDDVLDFAEEHAIENFVPGMKQAVQGDVDIKTISGQVAEIEEYLDFDVDMIMSGMPLPKYALGGFEEHINQFVSRAQETRFENQLEEARHEIVSEWTPILRAKAEELGHNPDEVELVIAEPPEQEEVKWTRPDAIEERWQEIDDDVEGVGPMDEGQDDEEDEDDEDGTDFTRPPASTEMYLNDPLSMEVSYEELADPRFVSVSDERLALSRVGEDMLRNIRNELVDEMTQEARIILSEDMLQEKAERLEDTAEFVIKSIFADDRLDEQAIPIIEDVIRKTEQRLDELGVEVDESMARSDNLLRFYRNVRSSLRDVGDSLAKDMRTHYTHGLLRGDDPSDIHRRIEEMYDDGKVRNRADLIGHMEVHTIIETTKLHHFEADENVIGVEVSNSCAETTTPLCRHLGGCEEGERVQVLFTENASVGELLQEHVPEHMLHAEFDPLPNVPPFHYGCSSQLQPIKRNL